MKTIRGLPLVHPRIAPALHPDFCPAVLANRAFRLSAGKNPLSLNLALERADGSTSRFHTSIAAPGTPEAQGNLFYVERLVKFLLWSRGAHRVYFAGPAALG